MSKIPPKFEQFLDGDTDDYPTELKDLLASKPPEFWGASLLKRIGHKKKPTLRIIRATCMDCCHNQRSCVRLCPRIHCPSWPYRLATDPFRKGREAEDA